TRWATSCPGRPSTRHSTPTSRGSREALPMPVSYASYLKLDELLSLQQPRSAGPEHDEMLFIVIHQVYELWFKEMLHELGYLEARYGQPTLWDAFIAYLAKNQYPVPPPLLARDVTRPPEPSREMQQVLITVYRTNPAVSSVCERLVDLDEGLMEWRYRHVKMVQRTIGTKPGTGGTAGAEYLTTTLNQPAFPDLWAIRTEL